MSNHVRIRESNDLQSRKSAEIDSQRPWQILKLLPLALTRLKTKKSFHVGQTTVYCMISECNALKLAKGLEKLLFNLWKGYYYKTDQMRLNDSLLNLLNRLNNPFATIHIR